VIERRSIWRQAWIDIVGHRSTAFIVAAVVAVLGLAATAVVRKTIQKSQTWIEALTQDGLPVVVAAGLWVILFVAYALLVVPYRQRNAAWYDLDQAVSEEWDVEYEVLRPSKARPRDHGWASGTRVYVMKLQIRNRSVGGDFMASGEWFGPRNSRTWSMGWEGREGLEAFIPRDEAAVLNTCTVVHRDGWYGYGLISNGERGPYLEIADGLRLRIRITRRDMEGSSESVFLVSAPESDGDRPSLRLIPG
jgi:hypothetical protein